MTMLIVLPVPRAGSDVTTAAYGSFVESPAFAVTTLYNLDDGQFQYEWLVAAYRGGPHDPLAGRTRLLVLQRPLRARLPPTQQPPYFLPTWEQMTNTIIPNEELSFSLLPDDRPDLYAQTKLRTHVDGIGEFAVDYEARHLGDTGVVCAPLRAFDTGPDFTGEFWTLGSSKVHGTVGGRPIGMRALPCDAWGYGTSGYFMTAGPTA